MELLQKAIDRHLEALSGLGENCENSFYDLCEDAVLVLASGGTLFFAGNGGSACDALHISAELTGRFITDRKGFRSISLSSDVAALSCISNDFGYEHVFSRQLEGLAKANDLFIGISTSGNSANILKAVGWCKSNKVRVWGLTGQSGGELIRILPNHTIRVPASHTSAIQEMHILLGHVLCEYIELKLLGISNYG